MTAAWEAFVEDLATDAFASLLNGAQDSSVIPAKVKSLAASGVLENQKNPADLWQLADAGWRAVLTKHKTRAIEKFVGPLNTPNAQNTDELLEALVGLRGVSAGWNWPGQTAKRSRDRLKNYIKVRGQIAHRLTPDASITKAYARSYANFVYRLAVKTANRVRAHVESLTGLAPWDSTTYRELVEDASRRDR